MPAELVRQTYFVAIPVTVTVTEIDDERVQALDERYHRAAAGADSSQSEEVARDRRLLAALLARPEALRRELLRHVAWKLDPIRDASDLRADLGLADATDAALIEALREDLPHDDVTFLHSLLEDDMVYENTTYYQDAFKTQVGRVALGDEADDATGTALGPGGA
jgi:hypothetical protein